MTGRGQDAWIMGRGAALLAALLVILSASEARAQQGGAPRVQVTPERTAVSVNEPFWVRVTITSEQGGSSVSLPPGSPFELVRNGGVSLQTSWVGSLGGGMQFSRSETTRLLIRASRPGRHTLGPIVITVGGQQYNGGTTTIEVTAGGPSQPPSQQPQPLPNDPFSGFPNDPFSGFPGLPQPQPQPQQPSPGQLPGQMDPADLTGAQYDSEVFLRTVVEPSEAYVGQQVVLSVYLYTTIQLGNVNVTREAATDGFWSEELYRPTSRLDMVDQFVGPTRFRVALLRQVALFPLREGSLTVGPVRMEASALFGSIFSRRSSSVFREGVPVQIQVRGLPGQDRPQGFSEGNVGHYSLKAKVDRRQVKVGEPVTLTLAVSGEGHLKNVKLAPLGEIDGARIYEPRINDVVTKTGGRIGGQRSWEYLILPQSAGSLVLPSVSFDFFDPATGHYETKRTKAIEVQVSGDARSSNGAEGDPEESGGAATEELVPLRSIRRQSALDTEASPLYSSWWFLVVVALTPIGFLTLIMIDGVRQRRTASRDAIRSRRAAQIALKQLEPVRGGQIDGVEGINQVMRTLNGFFVDRTGETVSGLTLKELRIFLIERSVPEELTDRVVALTEQSEKARYGGGKAGSLGQEMASEADELIRELDRIGMKEPRGGAS